MLPTTSHTLLIHSPHSHSECLGLLAYFLLASLFPSRVLKPSRTFLLITYGDPSSRMHHVARPTLGWQVEVFVLSRPDLVAGGPVYENGITIKGPFPATDVSELACLLACVLACVLDKQIKCLGCLLSWDRSSTCQGIYLLWESLHGYAMP